ncbi:MAG: glycosyltransferase, partial [Actinomycetota bacterium]
AVAAGLADTVEFYSSTFMPRVYASATILVLTSDFEGTPNVILEGMATGLPSVAFGVGGVPEVIVNRDVGVVVRPYDESAMVEAVLDLLRNPARREVMSRAASEYTARHRATAELPRFLRTLYRRVAATQHAGARLRAPGAGRATPR